MEAKRQDIDTQSSQKMETDVDVAGALKTGLN